MHPASSLSTSALHFLVQPPLNPHAMPRRTPPSHITLWPSSIPTPREYLALRVSRFPLTGTARGAPKYFLPARPEPLHTVEVQHRAHSPSTVTDASKPGMVDRADTYACLTGSVGVGVQVSTAASDLSRVDGSVTGMRDTVAAGTETAGMNGSSVSLPPWLRSKGFSDEEKAKIVQTLMRPGSALVR